jgi:large-conductance mechanosensitive channel
MDCGTGLNVAQSSFLQAKIMSSVTNDITVEIANDLKTLVDSSASALSQDSRDFLSRALGTTATDAVATITNALHTAIDNEVNVSNTTTIVNNIQVNQTTIFNNYGSLSAQACNFDQNATTIFYAQQTISNIVKSSALTTIQQQLQSQAEAEATTGKTKNKTLIWIILGVILGVGLIIGAIVLFISLRNKNKMQTVSTVKPATTAPLPSAQSIQATSTRAVKA